MSQTLRDAVLGELTYDNRLSRWDGTSAALGVPFSLSAHTFEESGRELWHDEAALEIYRTAFARLERDEPSLRAQMADKMAPLAEEWRDPDEDPAPVTPQGVLARVTFESFSIYEDGSAELFYNDDDLFGGHVIIASVDAAGALSEASIAG